MVQIYKKNPTGQDGFLKDVTSAHGFLWSSRTLTTRRIRFFPTFLHTWKHLSIPQAILRWHPVRKMDILPLSNTSLRSWTAGLVFLVTIIIAMIPWDFHDMILPKSFDKSLIVLRWSYDSPSRVLSWSFHLIFDVHAQSYTVLVHTLVMHHGSVWH